MQIKDIEKLADADKLMFNLDKSSNPKADILKVGKILQEFGMLEDASDLDEIVDVYDENVKSEIQKALRKKNNAVVKLIPESLASHLNSNDAVEIQFIKDCLDDFKKYGQIVLRFNNKKDAWKEEKSAAEYRQLFSGLDHTRTMIHNSCIDDLSGLNRLIKTDDSQYSAYAVWDNDNIKDIKEVYRGDIGNAIIKQYCTELVRRNQDVLEEIRN